MRISPLVSVVIPSFNHRAYIGRAIDSVLAQTCPDLEIVVIDDGSSDGSHDFIATRYGHDPRVKLTRRENRGAHRTLNEAVEASTGAFVSILNSDDFYEPTRLAAFVEAARRHERPFFGISALQLVDESGTPFDPASGYNEYYDMVCKLAAGQPDMFGLWCGNIAMTTSNFFFSRSIFDEIGPFRALRYAHDWDWALRASSRFDVRRISDKLLNYRIHGANTIFETDPWAHAVEDAFVWASALRKNAAGLPNEAPLFGGLLSNWGFPLLPTLYLLADRRGEAEQLALIASGALKEEIKALAEDGSADPLLWEALPGAVRTLRELRAQSEARASGAQDRDDKRAASDEFAALKRSKSWKLFGWLWRLETRKARKARPRK
jgi:glycosyltransferase involved in cell wall biosynthesis